MRKAVLAPLLRTVVNRMKRWEEEKRELDDRYNEQGHGDKQDPDGSQIAVPVRLLDLEDGLMNNQTDAVKVLEGADSVLSRICVLSLQCLFEPSHYTTSHWSSNGQTPKHHDRKIRGRSHGWRYLMARARDTGGN